MIANALSSTSQNVTFPVQLAIELKSTELAIIVQFFVNVISTHKRGGRNLIDGNTWNYCTKQELVEYFPFWTCKMVRTRIENLVKIGILKVGNFNEKKYDRTLWYAFVDEARWGIDRIFPICPNGQMDVPKQANEIAQMGTPIPPTYHTSTTSLQVNDTAPPSVTSSSQKKKSVFKGKAKLTAEQSDILDWLKAQKLDTGDDTLSWWARNYALKRLEEVLREAKKAKPRSIGAYMQKLLKTGASVVSGRIELNAEFATMLRDLKDWNALQIHQKYAKITTDVGNIEIDFNMDPDEFARYLQEKFEIYGGR